MDELFLNHSKQAASLAKGLRDISSLLVQSRMREDLYVRRTNAFRLGRDVVKWDDWDKLLGQIHNQERRFAAIEALWRDSGYDEECSEVKKRHQESLHKLGEISTDLSSMRSAQIEKNRQELLDWLSDVDPSEIYNTARDKHGAGTGEWLTMESEEFKAWKESPCSLLWLHGKAGSGKSVLSSVVIKHLQDAHASDSSSALAYFFFSFSDSKKQNVNKMLASLVKQLCSRRPDTPQPIKSLSEYKEKGQRPDTKTLGAILTTVARGFSAVYIIIDALDECPLLDGERGRLFSSLRQIMAAAPAKVHMFCTSRREADIDSAMGTLLPSPLQVAMIDMTVRRNVIDHDIDLFIDLTLSSYEYLSWPESIRAEARKSLVERADGMFQYVFCQLEVLQRHSSARLVREALRGLPLGLDATYDRLLLSLDVKYRSHIVGCLKWLAFSNKPLKLEQLAKIFMLCPKDGLPLDDSDHFFDAKDVLKFLSGLVVLFQVDRSRFAKDTCIRLAHFSVKEYLISSRIREGPAKAFAFGEINAHLHIAHCCLAYHLQRSAMVEDDFKDLQLGEYAAVQWPLHLEMVPRTSWPAEVTQAARQALAIISPGLDHQLREKWPPESMLLYHDDKPMHLRLRPQCYTARFGFTQLTEMLLSRETAVNKYLTQGDLNAALHDAAYGGSSTAVQLCLRKGADVNSKSEVFGDALQAAAYNGVVGGARLSSQLDVLKLLVSRGADIDLPSNECGCVLTSTVTKYSGGSSLECLLYLLEAGADINRRGGGIHGTALHKAAMNMRADDAKKLFHLLLERDADVNAPGGQYGYPLQAACASGGSYLKEIKLLLDKGADANARGGRFGNALQAACHRRDPCRPAQAIELLIDRGADVNAQGGYFGTALQAACSKGRYEPIVHLLLDKGADVNSRGGEYGSPLNAACLFAQWEVPLPYDEGNTNWIDWEQLPLIRRLLERGVELNEPCGRGGTALQAACEGSLFELVRELLDRGADVNVQGGKYGTALQAACVGKYNDRVGIFRLLLEHGADAHAQGGFFGSVWHAAAAQLNRDFTPVLQQLLDLGVDINDARGKQHPTALHAALGRVLQKESLGARWIAHPEVEESVDRIRFLIDHGADVNLVAGIYGSPLQLACAMEAEANCDWYNSINDGYEDQAIHFLKNSANLDFNKPGGLFGSALQAATWTGKTEVVRILLNKGAHVNACGGKYRSPLNAAVFRGHWDIVEMLLGHGAKPDCYHSQEPDKAWLQQVEEECGEKAVERYQLFWTEQKSQCASSV
ncbi:hypothetical protein ACHAPE_002584 [Trichoderma viride]